jgi:hypothetical protein
MNELTNLGNELCSAHVVSSNLLVKSGSLCLYISNLSQSVLLNGHTKIVSILYLGNKESNPHLEKVGRLNQLTNLRLDDLEHSRNNFVASHRSFNKSIEIMLADEPKSIFLDIKVPEGRAKTLVPVVTITRSSSLLCSSLMM